MTLQRFLEARDLPPGIDPEHENYVRKPMALKIFRIIDEIFQELAESSGNAQSHDEVMN